MIEPECAVCGEELYDPGAILLSPPIDNMCIKMHICIYCWKKMFAITWNEDE